MPALLASNHYTNTTLLGTDHWRTCTPNGRWCRVRPHIPILRLGKYYLPTLVEEIEVDGVTYSIYEEVIGDRLSAADLNMMLELYLIVEDLFKAGWIHGDICEENVVLTSMGIKLVSLDSASRVGDTQRSNGMLCYPPSAVTVTEGIVKLKEGWRPCCHIDHFHIGVLMHAVSCRSLPRPMINAFELEQPVTDTVTAALTAGSCWIPAINTLLAHGACRCGK